MRRRSSEFAAEDEGDDSSSNVEILSSIEGAGVKAKLDDSPPVKDLRNLQTTARHLQTQHASYELDRRKSTEKRPSSARSRRPSNTNWKPAESRNGYLDKERLAEPPVINMPSKEAIAADKMAEPRLIMRRSKLSSPWSCSLLTVVTTALAALSLFSIMHSFVGRQLDEKGCRMSYMRPSFAKLSEFDTEHTRFASKYSVYLYREGMIDEDTKVRRNLLICRRR